MRSRRTLVGPEEKSMLGACLLRIEHHGDVYIGERPDTTKEPHAAAVGYHIVERPANSVIMKQQLQVASERVSMSSPMTGPAVEINYTRKDGPCYDKKTHYRIVFTEVGTPLHEITSWSLAFRVLAAVVGGERRYLSCAITMA